MILADSEITKNIKKLFNDQKDNRWAVAQSSIADRITKLQRLKQNIILTEAELKKALENDFLKPEFETEVTEIFIVLEEINHAIHHLKKWAKPLTPSSPLILWGVRSEVHYEPKGQVLIVAPWNYPFMLLMGPLINAISAGNCVIARPSGKTSHTAAYLKRLIEMSFDSNEVAVVLGNSEVADILLQLPFDHICFTGSTSIGKKVLTAAAKNLSTVTLELGGKSPAIIGVSADLAEAAQRICWGKFLNAGQTCVCPDYVLVSESKADAFLKLLQEQIISSYGSTIQDRKQSPFYARIIDHQAFDRLQSLFTQTLSKGAKTSFGGEMDRVEKYIEPTVLDKVNFDHPIMEQEIFGPILPILRYRSLEDDVLLKIRHRDKPLALYIFSKDQLEINHILSNTTAGGTVINHVNIHFGNPHTPLGGVGASGMGRHHGFFGFREFSNERTVLHQRTKGFTHWLYPPYKGWKFRIAKTVMRFLSR